MNDDLGISPLDDLLRDLMRSRPEASPRQDLARLALARMAAEDRVAALVAPSAATRRWRRLLSGIAAILIVGVVVLGVYRFRDAFKSYSSDFAVTETTATDSTTPVQSASDSSHLFELELIAGGLVLCVIVALSLDRLITPDERLTVRFT